MPRMESGCHNALENISQIFAENGIHARAWLSTLERTCWKWRFALAWIYSLAQTTNLTKVLDVCFSRSPDARSLLERETQTLTPAWLPSLERTVTHMNFWVHAFHARARLTLLERKCTLSECPLEREVPRSSVDQIFRISRFDPRVQIQPPRHQTQFFWAKL